jgi:hypothetical protein
MAKTSKANILQLQTFLGYMFYFEGEHLMLYEITLRQIRNELTKMEEKSK